MPIDDQPIPGTEIEPSPPPDLEATLPTDGGLTLFSKFVAGFRMGNTDDELSAALADVVQAVQHYGQSGSLTFTVKVTSNGGQAVRIVDSISTKLPKPPRAEAIYFTDHAGSLFREDPYQQTAGYDRLT